MKVLVLGRGRVGNVIWRELSRVGANVALRASRGRLSIGDADVIILAVRDAALSSLSEGVAAQLKRGAVVLHCAGNAGPKVLAACKKAGAHVGVMHPLVSIADRKKSPVLDGTTFVVDGDRRARTCATRLVKEMGARPLIGAWHGARYHAAAVLLVGGTLATLSESVKLLISLGMPKKDAIVALGGLVRSVGENVINLGLPNALTGPIVRGDANTVRAHRASFKTLREVDRAYVATMERMLRIAVEGGLSKHDALEVKKSLAQRQRNK